MGWNVSFPCDDVGKYIEGLPGRAKDKLLKLIQRLEALGNQLGEPDSKPLSGGLFELKTRGKGAAQRAYYMFQPGQRILILHIAPKSNKRREQQEIALARQRRSEILMR